MDDDPLDLIGDVLGEHFRIEGFAGEGLLSVVYRARHVVVDAPVAVKCLSLPSTLDSDFSRPIVENFQEGCRLHYELARGNLNIAQTLASGTTLAPRTGATIPYLVREWFEGESLARNLERRRPTDDSPTPPPSTPRTIDDAIAMLEHVADGLAYAHDRKISHLSLRPSNIFLAVSEGKVRSKILDFGVGRAVDQAQADLPGIRAQILFPGYAAPEQLHRGLGDVGPATDVYSLALLLLEILSDRPVVAEPDVQKAVLQVLDRDARPSPRSHGLTLSAPLEKVFDRAFSLDPAGRYADARAFWRALRQAAAYGRGLRIRPALANPRGRRESSLGPRLRDWSQKRASERKPQAFEEAPTARVSLPSGFSTPPAAPSPAAYVSAKPIPSEAARFTAPREPEEDLDLAWGDEPSESVSDGANGATTATATATDASSASAEAPPKMPSFITFVGADAEKIGAKEDASHAADGPATPLVLPPATIDSDAAPKLDSAPPFPFADDAPPMPIHPLLSDPPPPVFSFASVAPAPIPPSFTPLFSVRRSSRPPPFQRPKRSSGPPSLRLPRPPALPTAERGSVVEPSRMTASDPAPPIAPAAVPKPNKTELSPTSDTSSSPTIPAPPLVPEHARASVPDEGPQAFASLDGLDVSAITSELPSVPRAPLMPHLASDEPTVPISEQVKKRASETALTPLASDFTRELALEIRRQAEASARTDPALPNLRSRADEETQRRRLGLRTKGMLFPAIAGAAACVLVGLVAVAFIRSVSKAPTATGVTPAPLRAEPAAPGPMQEPLSGAKPSSVESVPPKPSSESASSTTSASSADSTKPSSMAVPRFQMRTAKSALDRVGKDVSSCRGEKKALWGTGGATVKFGNDGKVVEVLLGPPYRTAPEGACVATKLKEADMGPFEGPAFAVAYSFFVPFVVTK